MECRMSSRKRWAALSALVIGWASIPGSFTASAETYPPRGHLGGGFIEAVFGQAPRSPQGSYSATPPASYRDPGMVPQDSAQRRASLPPLAAEPQRERAIEMGIDSRYRRQEVAYTGKERPGTLVIDTPNRYLYLVLPEGRAIRYGIGVGRPGFEWAGVKSVSDKREWPDWRPPPQMLKRRPDLPRFMEGGPDNPLGARALYLGSSLYRIHGTNEPHTIGQAVSSGCIRMTNSDVTDLYERVRVGTRVIVI